MRNRKKERVRVTETKEKWSELYTLAERHTNTLEVKVFVWKKNIRPIPCGMRHCNGVGYHIQTVFFSSLLLTNVHHFIHTFFTLNESKFKNIHSWSAIFSVTVLYFCVKRNVVSDVLFEKKGVIYLKLFFSFSTTKQIEVKNHGSFGSNN